MHCAELHIVTCTHCITRAHTQTHEIVGILPSEEAAIQKALMASITKTSSEGQEPYNNNNIAHWYYNHHR